MYGVWYTKDMSDEVTTNREPVRILHVFGRLDLGGAETRTIDLLRAIDRTQVQFDFLVHTQDAGYYDRTVEALGARIFHVPRFRGHNRASYEKALRLFFSKHRGMWRMVHGHMTSTAAIYLPIAREYGGCVTIAHARSAGVDKGPKGWYTKRLRLPLRQEETVDFRFAVSREAAEAVFGSELVDEGKVRILPNAIDAASCRYDPAARLLLRTDLGIPSDARVIGHVGRFHPAKNHAYLIRVFAYLVRDVSDGTGEGSGMSDTGRAPYYLLLIGDGPLLAEMRALVRAEGIEDRVIFAGKKTPVAPYFSVIDLLFFPSLYEGFPGTVLEAQAAGLPCLVSDTVTGETGLTELVRFFDTGGDVADTAGILRGMMAQAPVLGPVGTGSAPGADPDSMSVEDPDGTQRESVTDDARIRTSAQAIRTICDAGYDVRQQAREMEGIYLDMR